MRKRVGNNVEIAKTESRRAMTNDKSQIFRGFISGDGFLTKKGYRGSKLASLWTRQIFEAFPNDDEELAVVALDSCLADLEATVEGGEFGSPYCIGDFAFYSDNQFQAQTNLLISKEKKYCPSSAYLTEKEWLMIEDKIGQLGRYATARFQRSRVGDTFACLSIRENAYLIAALLLEKGVDPLAVNVDSEDLYCILKQQYAATAMALSEIQDERTAKVDVLQLPSEMNEIDERERTLVEHLRSMRTFSDVLWNNIEKRKEQIEKDKWSIRVFKLKNQMVPHLLLHNVSLEERITTIQEEIPELKSYIDVRVKKFDDKMAVKVSLSTIVHVHEKFIGNRKKTVVKNNKNFMHGQKAGILSAEQLKARLGIKSEDEETMETTTIQTGEGANARWEIIQMPKRGGIKDQYKPVLGEYKKTDLELTQYR